jgi:hypothetical protein
MLAPEQRVLERLDRAWPVVQARNVVFDPPRYVPSPQTPARRPASVRTRSDWITKHMNPDSPISLDSLPSARQQLWRLRWADGLGLCRRQVLATTLAIQAIGFGECLVGWQALRGLAWPNIVEADPGAILALQLKNAVGQLQVWVGPSERLLIDQLRSLGSDPPFAGIDEAMLDRVASVISGRSSTLKDLCQANRLAHLFSHTSEETAYLMGELGHKLVAG